IVDKMLANFEARLPDGYGQQAAAQGLTVFQAITVASLIEREAVVDEERPIIASVIYNRLAAGQRLEIDAATQYVLGQPGLWWPRLDGLDLRAIVSPYNTYAVEGLPPGPVSNPGLSSIIAAGSPATTDYLYYRARCDGSGRHFFAATYEEHLANACQ
ncbi:MAG: endolytic transglycosylase MltG, partial [Anaerolineales bacterium]